MTTRRCSAQGFTLVELLVALLLMAGIAVMAWRGIDGMLRSREISQAHLEQTERLLTVLAQWEQDLAQLQDSGQIEAISFDGASLLLTRRQDEGLQLVRWTLREGRLSRWTSAAHSTRRGLAEAETQSHFDERGAVTVLQGLAGWQLYFYRGNAWSNAQSSADVAAAAPAPASAPSAPAGPLSQKKKLLPEALRMVLEFAPGGALSGNLTRQVSLESQP